MLIQSRLGPGLVLDVMISTIFAVFELIVERNDLTIDLGTDAAIAHARMDAIGKINGNAAKRQVNDVTLGRKDKDFVRKKRPS